MARLERKLSLQTLSLGKHNPKLVELRKAIRAADLTPEGLLPIEGPRLFDEAVRSGIGIMDVFLRRGVGIDAPAKTPVYELDEATFKSIQSTETSQGVIALVRPRTFSLDEILKAANPRIVVLVRLQDPGNVGTILRIAESFRATACIAVTGTVNIYNTKTVRASAGSVFRLPHVWNLDLDDVITRLKALKLFVVGTSPAADSTIDAWDWRKPCAILVGNEGRGLTSDEAKKCDALLRIPQNAAVDSLNSAIATAIILYEASRHERIAV